MKRLCHILCLCLTLVFLGACGPKEVGHGTATPEPTIGRDPAVELRYPMDGNRIQQRLYTLNQPHIMEMQKQAIRQSLAPKPDQDDVEKKPFKHFGPFRE